MNILILKTSAICDNPFAVAMYINHIAFDLDLELVCPRDFGFRTL